MYLVNSYHHVLKNIDSSWGDSTISSNSQSGKRTRRRKIDSSHSFSQSSRRSSQTYASSSESGLYSEELVNSGYYGDDEVDRCSCIKCVSEALAVKPKTDIVADYDIISVDLSESTTPELQLSCKPIRQSNFDDYVIIPSSKEEFFADALAHSTSISEKNSHGSGASVKSTAVAQVTVSLEATVSLRYSCKLLEEDKSDSFSTKTAALQRVAGKNDSTSCGWRKDIVRKLQKRNDTETKRFSQLQTDNQSCRAKVRINRELAEYLNKYPDLGPQTETTCNVMVNMEVDPIERSELFLAIRNQRTPSSDETGEYPRPRSDSIAHLAATYLKRQRTLTERKLTESEGSYSPACARSRISNRAGRRERVPGKKLRESIVNQLEMRNFLEFKYFTDTLARRTISQLSISENFPHPMKGVDEYDIITDDEVSSLDSRSTLMNSAHSTSHSQGYYSSTFSSRFFNLKRGKRR